MTTLNRDNTDLFCALRQYNNELTSGNVSDLFRWLHEKTSIISNTDYASIKSAYLSWASDYATGNLKGTRANGTEYVLQGIGTDTTPPDR